MKRSIVFINALSAKLGGGRTYLINLLSYHSDSNVLVYIACPDKSILPKSGNIRYVGTPFANKNILFRAVWEFIFLPRILHKLNVDTLFVPGGMDFSPVDKHVKKVTMFRNMLPFDKIALKSLDSKLMFLKNMVLKKLMIRTMNSADHVIFISKYAKSSVSNLLELNEYSVIYHGIATDFSPIKTLSVNVAYNNTILYVSRFEPYKNHLNLIKAYNLLSDELKKKHPLLLVGEGMEPTLSLCKEYIDSNDLGSKVTIVGKVEYKNLPELYQSCELFVFPSSCENCPNILLEAIGCCAPIVTSKTPPMPEFARESALYFDESDVKSIHSTIERVLNDQELRLKLKRRSNNLRQEFTWQKTANLTWQSLKKMEK